MTVIELYDNAGHVPLDVWRHLFKIKVPIFDIDNTLTDFHSKRLVPEVADGLKAQNIAKIFPRIALASNNSNQSHVDYIGQLLQEDLGLEEVYEISANSRVGRLRKKPAPDMGNTIAGHFDINSNELGVIGDRYMTDVAFGRRLGAGAIALCKKVGARDVPLVPVLRPIESGLVLAERIWGSAEDNRVYRSK